MTCEYPERKDAAVRRGRMPCRRAGILLALVLALVMTLAPSVKASTSDSLIDAKAKQAELEAERNKLEKETAQLEKSFNKLEGQLAWLNGRSTEQKKIYQDKTSQLQAAVTSMAEAYGAYADAVEDLQLKQKQYVERMQTMFLHQKRSLLEVFLKANSLQGFFTTMQFMTIVADTDQQMLEELEAAKDHATLMREQAEQNAADMSLVVAQLKADLEQLKADKSATEKNMQKVELKLSAKERAEDALNAESEQVAAEVAVLQKKLAAERAAQATAAAKATAAAQATRAAQNKPSPTAEDKPSAAGWVWPYPADHTVHSYYGMRFHPIYHVYRFHSGVDLGGKYGYPIVAAHDGTVLLVRNPREGSNTGGSGYGNYIVIDHGDGFSTLYAHLKDTLVRVGAEVKAGDKIATCGSTGTSTGPHLHFEVMTDGHTVNPLDYVR
jgi:murein DD-endopeptidase MepM/ murein hydrolase activator NlpD